MASPTVTATADPTEAPRPSVAIQYCMQQTGQTRRERWKQRLAVMVGLLTGCTRPGVDCGPDTVTCR